MVHHDAGPDAKVFMDAPPPVYDFSCMTNPAPANGQAAANITLSGTVSEVGFDLATQMPTITAVDGASLTACKAGTTCNGPTNKLAGPVTSAGGGMWSLGPISTSTNPVDGYIAMTKTGDRDTYEYPPQALIADLADVPVLTFNTTTFSLLSQYLQTGQQAGNGNLAIAVTDCANTAIDGATVTVKQGGTDVPNTTDIDLGTLSAMGAGVHAVFNVPPGDTEVNATYMGMTLHAHVVHVFADSTTATIVRPGYY